MNRQKTRDPLLATSELRDGFRFRGGHAALDFAATLAARIKPSPRDLLATPADLDRWLAAAGLASRLPSTADDLSSARALREAIYSLSTAVIAGAPMLSDAVATLNRIAQAPSAVPHLGDDGRLHLDGPPSAFLATLARDAIQLFGADTAGRLRQCESDSCALLFFDTSRGGDRRWCSMTGCGNKAKVAEFRRRKREAS
jgi:predicted RNA-binding Zn ribbon-like protein